MSMINGLCKYFKSPDEDSEDHSAEILEDNGLILNAVFIPEEVLCNILSFVDAHSLVHSCRLVCQIWRNSIDNDVWKSKVRRLTKDKLSSFSKLSMTERLRLRLPWLLYYSIFSRDPFEKNLLKNNCGQGEYQ